MVSAKTRAPPTLSSSRLTLVTTANFSPSFSTASATRPRLVEIDGLRTSLRHGAEAAAPRAQIAQQHERRGAMVPALADIGAVRRLANRMQVQLARQRLQVVIVLAHGRARLQPVRLRRRPARR